MRALPVGLLVRRHFGHLRFPQLFALALAVFLIDLFIPDLIPFVDEILLGLLTILLGSVKRPARVSPPEVPR
jgi:hypothetical protein